MVYSQLNRKGILKNLPYFWNFSLGNQVENKPLIPIYEECNTLGSSTYFLNTKAETLFCWILDSSLKNHFYLLDTVLCQKRIALKKISRAYKESQNSMFFKHLTPLKYFYFLSPKCKSLLHM